MCNFTFLSVKSVADTWRWFVSSILSLNAYFCSASGLVHWLKMEAVGVIPDLKWRQWTRWRARLLQLSAVSLHCAVLKCSSQMKTVFTAPNLRSRIYESNFVSVFNVVPGKWLLPCTDLRLANGKVMLSPFFFANQNKSCRQAGLPAQFLMTKKQEERRFKGRSKIYGGRRWFSISTGLHCGLTGVFTYARLILAALASDTGGYYARSLKLSDSLAVLGSWASWRWLGTEQSKRCSLARAEDLDGFFFLSSRFLHKSCTGVWLKKQSWGYFEIEKSKKKNSEHNFFLKKPQTLTSKTRQACLIHFSEVLSKIVACRYF